MNEEFEFLEKQNIFDFKAFLFRVISYWKLFILCVGIGLVIAYQLNIRKQSTYRLSTQISIQDDKNPLFTSNTSLTFNWGGVTGKVQTVVVTLKSRSHNEKVVDRLNFYMQYLKQGRFRKEDVYKYAPFTFHPNKDFGQVLNKPIKVTLLNKNEYKLEINLPSKTVLVQNYNDKSKYGVPTTPGLFSKVFKVGEEIYLPFLSGKLIIDNNRTLTPGEEYFLKFVNFDGVVSSYKGRLSVSNGKNSSILNIGLSDVNKAKIVDYLNETIKVLSEDQLNRKNQFATNTINFIEKQLLQVKDQLENNASELNEYRKKNKIFNIEEESINLSEKLVNYDLEKEAINRKLSYYAILQNYLLNSRSFTDIPAPSIAGIDDANIVGNVGRINELSVQKSKLEYSVRNDASIFNDLDRQIEGLKAVLLENISAANKVSKSQLKSINTKLSIAESQFSKLPEDQQELLQIERQYNLSEQTYNVFLAKLGEAGIVKASNISDILVIDSAKDIGGGRLGTNNNANYLLAIFAGLLLPSLLAFIVTLTDKNIHGPQDVESLSAIPIIGVIGKNKASNNLAVFRKPKSAVAEAFRAIRSSLQYMYKKHNLEGSKTVMVTSSVSGEGKTFCSINVATVFALSEKKTILVGLDLRKPKIFGDFNIQNNIGVVNYLIGEKSLNEVIQQTEIPYLE
ncbi:MAG: sugar transporter, partial [Bacteroidia bacterium]|nr:sugar transporter [Bacteroidia bacterium]